MADTDIQKDDMTEPKDIELGSIVVDICCHPNRDVIAAGTIDGDVKLYSYSIEESNHQLLSFEHHKKSCRAIRFCPVGARLYTVSKDKSLQCIDIEKGAVCNAILKAHSAAIYSLLVVDENIVATGDDDGNLKVWDVRRNIPVMDVKESEEFISDMVIDSKKKLLLASSGEGTLTAYDVRKHKMTVQSELFDSEMLSLAAMKNEEKLIVGDGEGVINIFNWNEWGNISDRFPGHPSSIDCMLPLTRDMVATGSEDGIIRALNVAPNRFLGVLGEHGGFPIENLSKSHCSKLLASCSHDQHIKFWNIQDIDNIKVDPGHRPKRGQKTKHIGKTVARSGFFADLNEDEDEDDDMDGSESSDVTNTDGDSEASYNVIEVPEKDEITGEGTSASNIS